MNPIRQTYTPYNYSRPIAYGYYQGFVYICSKIFDHGQIKTVRLSDLYPLQIFHTSHIVDLLLKVSENGSHCLTLILITDSQNEVEVMRTLSDQHEDVARNQYTKYSYL